MGSLPSGTELRDVTQPLDSPIKTTLHRENSTPQRCLRWFGGQPPKPSGSLALQPANAAAPMLTAHRLLQMQQKPARTSSGKALSGILSSTYAYINYKLHS